MAQEKVRWALEKTSYEGLALWSGSRKPHREQADILTEYSSRGSGCGLLLPPGPCAQKRPDPELWLPWVGWCCHGVARRESSLTPCLHTGGWQPFAHPYPSLMAGPLPPFSSAPTPPLTCTGSLSLNPVQLSWGLGASC